MQSRVLLLRGAVGTAAHFPSLRAVTACAFRPRQDLSGPTRCVGIAAFVLCARRTRTGPPPCEGWRSQPASRRDSRIAVGTTALRELYQPRCTSACIPTRVQRSPWPRTPDRPIRPCRRGCGWTRTTLSGSAPPLQMPTCPPDRELPLVPRRVALSPTHAGGVGIAPTPPAHSPGTTRRRGRPACVLHTTPLGCAFELVTRPACREPSMPGGVPRCQLKPYISSLAWASSSSHHWKVPSARRYHHP